MKWLSWMKEERLITITTTTKTSQNEDIKSKKPVISFQSRISSDAVLQLKWTITVFSSSISIYNNDGIFALRSCDWWQTLQMDLMHSWRHTNSTRETINLWYRITRRSRWEVWIHNAIFCHRLVTASIVTTQNLFEITHEYQHLYKSKKQVFSLLPIKKETEKKKKKRKHDNCNVCLPCCCCFQQKQSPTTTNKI